VPITFFEELQAVPQHILVLRSPSVWHIILLVEALHSLCCLLALASGLSAAAIEFNRDIRPLLSDRCFACHGPDASHRKTKFRFDIESSATAALAGGRHAIDPGNPEASEIIKRVSSTNRALRMPPAYAKKDALTGVQIDLLRRWIAEGAHW